MAKDMEAIWARMVEEMCELKEGVDLLEACMSLSEEAIRYVPLRYRIIALGFVKGFSLQELNDKLAQQGCPRLYSRSFWEATLIFAFLNGYSFPQWKEVQAQCRDLSEALEGSAWFRDKKITYAELERYVLENSQARGDIMATQMRTQYMERALLETGESPDALRAFLAANIQSFSSVREKTRYYFCKYLYYWLNRRIENYLEACRRGCGVNEALSELLCLKVVTTLRRSQTMPEEEKRALIRASAVSCGEIFDAFNYFYFGYVTVDWVEALMECYERAEDIPAAHRRSLAQVFRKSRPEWKKKPDDEVIALKLREAAAREDALFAGESVRGGGKNRDGENALYKYIRGVRDIDRTVLLCFLLFFASDADMPAEHRLTTERVQEILAQCGYPALDTEDDFDWFVVEFLESRHPMDYLIDVMLDYARLHENSFLYHVYGHAVQYEDELVRVMLGKGEGS